MQRKMGKENGTQVKIFQPIFPGASHQTERERERERERKRKRESVSLDTTCPWSEGFSFSCFATLAPTPWKPFLRRLVPLLKLLVFRRKVDGKADAPQA